MAPGVGHEFVEVEGLIYLAQIIVKKGFVGVLESTLKLSSNRGNVVIWLWRGFRQEFQKPPRLPHLFDRILKTRGMKMHHPADEIAQMVSRVGVVTDVGDALRVKHFSTNCQNTFPHRVCDPGIQTMGNNKIESPKSLRTRLTDVHRMVGDIPQFEVPDVR